MMDLTLDAIFDRADGLYFDLAETTSLSDITTAWVNGLDEDLKYIWASSFEYHKELMR